jgi:GGDEF domain-containing protein
MKNLRNSVVSLFLFFSVVLSIAQVEYFEKNVLNFQAAFFVMLVVATLIGIWNPLHIKMSMYSYLGAWTLAYIFVWAFYWRFLSTPRTFEELVVQFLLLEVAAALSYNVGVQIGKVSTVLSEVANGAYPNRTLDLKMAADAIQREMTRSRRYSRPLSILVFQFGSIEIFDEQFQGVEKELAIHFFAAKIGRVINEYARQTDLIMRDYSRRFVILCPETNEIAAQALVQRIYSAIENAISDSVTWSTASFPDEALSFEELYEKALSRLPNVKSPSVIIPEEKINIGS